MSNAIYTPFTATTTPATIVPARPARRSLQIQVYDGTDYPSNATAYVNAAGGSNVGWQVGPGAAWPWGVMAPREFSHPQASVLPNCPTGPIVIWTLSGTAVGVILEII